MTIQELYLFSPLLPSCCSMILACCSAFTSFTMKYNSIHCFKSLSISAWFGVVQFIARMFIAAMVNTYIHTYTVNRDNLLSVYMCRMAKKSRGCFAVMCKAVEQNGKMRELEG